MKILEAIKRKKIIKKLKYCGENLILYGNQKISAPENISIGKDVRINDNVFLQGGGGIYIGDDVTLSKGVTLLTRQYNFDEFKNGNRVHDNMPIHIGNNVWLCANVIVTPGVTISGKYVIVAAGSVVTHDIKEDNCVYGGVPAKKIKNI